MNQRQRNALDRAAQEAQDRTRRNWNHLVQTEEQATRDAVTEAERRRSQFHIVSDSTDA